MVLFHHSISLFHRCPAPWYIHSSICHPPPVHPWPCAPRRLWTPRWIPPKSWALWVRTATGGHGRGILMATFRCQSSYLEDDKCDQFGRWWRCIFAADLIYEIRPGSEKKHHRPGIQVKKKNLESLMYNWYNYRWKSMKNTKQKIKKTAKRFSPNSALTEVWLCGIFPVANGSSPLLSQFPLVGQVSPSGFRMLSDKTQRKNCLKPRKTEPWRKKKKKKVVKFRTLQGQRNPNR